MKLFQWTIIISALIFLSDLTLYARDLAGIEETIELGGLTRRYYVHLPSGRHKREGLPVVIALHGGGGHAANISRMSGLSAVADREGFAVIYPDGSGRFSGRLLTWNAGNCCGYALDRDVDDVSFLRLLIDSAVAKYRLDPERVYMTGLSNGAMMAYRAACELSDRIAAIAPVAGALNFEGCTPKNPVSVMAIHGTADQNVPYDGGNAGGRRIDRRPRTDKSVSYAIDFWRRVNSCTGSPRRPIRGNVSVEDYTSCSNGSEVKRVTLEGGGHVWPGGRKGRVLADEPDVGYPASEEIWRFFKDKRRH